METRVLYWDGEIHCVKDLQSVQEKVVKTLNGNYQIPPGKVTFPYVH